MIELEVSGFPGKTESFLERISSDQIFQKLETYARQGVSALAAATPYGSGETAESWDYTIERKRGSYSIIWTNRHLVGDTPLVILLQYGHGTGTGGYVQGRDFINPAIKPVMDQIAENVWKAVTSA